MATEAEKLKFIRSIKQDLDLKTHEIKLTDDQINGNAASSIITAIEEMKAGIIESKEKMSKGR